MAFDFSARKMEDTARLMVPQILLLLLMFLNMASIPLPYAGTVKAHLVLMAVYYWSIYRLTLVPASWCFCIGLAMDVIGGPALGLNALVLVLIQWVVRDQRKFLMGQPYFVIWAAFGLVTLCALLMQWALSGLVGLQWIPLAPVMGSMMITMLLFPLVGMILLFTHRILPVPPRTYQ